MDNSDGHRKNLARTAAKAIVSLLPKKLQKKLFLSYWASRSPDRVFLVNTIVPAFAAKAGVILWVGCEDYTKKYPSLLEKEGATCWTLEIDAAKKKWGARHHVVSDILDVERHFGPETFDSVLCNGVFGWGIDTVDQQERALRAMATILKPGGILLLGWNTYKPNDPIELNVTGELFAPYSLPGLDSHYEFKESRHKYAILRKI